MKNEKTGEAAGKGADALRSHGEASIELYSAAAENMKRLVDLNLKLARMAIEMSVDGYAGASGAAAGGAPKSPGESAAQSMSQLNRMYAEVSQAVLDMTLSTQAAIAKTGSQLAGSDANRLMTEWQSTVNRATEDMRRFMTPDGGKR